MARRCATDGPDNAAFELGVVLGEAGAGRPRQAYADCAARRSRASGRGSSSSSPSHSGSRGRASFRSTGKRRARRDVYGNDRVFVQRALGGSARCGGRCAGRTSSSARAPGRPHRLARSFSAGRGVLPMGVRDGSGHGRGDAASIPSISPTSRQARSSHAESPASTKIGQAARRSTAHRSRTLRLRGPAQSECAWKARFRRFDVKALLDQMQRGTTSPARLHRDERAAPECAASDSRSRPRSPEGRDERRVRASVSSTRPARRTRAGRTAGCFCRSRAMTPRTCRCPASATASARSSWLQARGDFEVLADRGRRLLRVHLKNVDEGLRELHAAVQQWLMSESAGAFSHARRAKERQAKALRYLIDTSVFVAFVPSCLRVFVSSCSWFCLRGFLFVVRSTWSPDGTAVSRGIVFRLAQHFAGDRRGVALRRRPKTSTDRRWDSLRSSRSTRAGIMPVVSRRYSNSAAIAFGIAGLWQRRTRNPVHLRPFHAQHLAELRRVSRPDLEKEHRLVRRQMM